MSSCMTNREGGIGLESPPEKPPSKLPMTLSVARKAIVGLPSRVGAGSVSTLACMSGHCRLALCRPRPRQSSLRTPALLADRGSHVGDGQFRIHWPEGGQKVASLEQRLVGPVVVAITNAVSSGLARWQKGLPASCRESAHVVERRSTEAHGAELDLVQAGLQGGMPRQRAAFSSSSTS
jgi:hypothetical protein